jgi:outer membrane protein TolC
MSARAGLKGAQLSRTATRSEVVLITRRQFYEVVKAIKLAEVAEGSLKLAQDDERRVRAMFEVGSVSKSDLLKAQVRSAQSELSRLQANQAVTVQRIALAGILGLPESRLGEVDTVLVVAPRTFDEAEVLAEAQKNWPDLHAAEANYRSARGAVTSAKLARIPSLSISGSMDIDPFSSSTSKIEPPGAPPFINPGTSSTSSRTHRNYSGSVALSWNIFDGLATESRIASARANLLRAKDTYEALQRNLAGEVQKALLAYREATESNVVAQRGLESALENLKLTQEKYNVGSATILELIDAQVQLETAQSDHVTAQAALRVAEAQIDRVRGRSE